LPFGVSGKASSVVTVEGTMYAGSVLPACSRSSRADTGSPLEIT
jgi:hypothetical protein